MRQPPTVGQTLYSLNIGNRKGTAQVLTPVKVLSVGRKFFYCLKEGWPEHCKTKHRLEDWKEENGYSPNCELYLSEQEYADEKEAKQICNELEQAFLYGRNSKKISLNNLRLIMQICESSNPFMNMLSETGPEVLAYIRSLKEGEEVIETTRSGMYGKKGVVYKSKDDNAACVKWELGDGKWMGTTITWGTRRITDVKA